MVYTEGAGPMLSDYCILTAFGNTIMYLWWWLLRWFLIMGDFVWHFWSYTTTQNLVDAIRDNLFSAVHEGVELKMPSRWVLIFYSLKGWDFLLFYRQHHYLYVHKDALLSPTATLLSTPTKTANSSSLSLRRKSVFLQEILYNCITNANYMIKAWCHLLNVVIFVHSCPLIEKRKTN